MRLRTAEKLEAEADRVKYLNSSDTKQSAKRPNCSSISIRRTPALCYRTNWNHENRCHFLPPTYGSLGDIDSSKNTTQSTQPILKLSPRFLKLSPRLRCVHFTHYSVTKQRLADHDAERQAANQTIMARPLVHDEQGGSCLRMIVRLLPNLSALKELPAAQPANRTKGRRGDDRNPASFNLCAAQAVG